MFRLPVVAALLLGAPSAAVAYDCNETTCPQMTSCAEAHYKFKVCGHAKRDADNDDIPCENLCGDDMATYRARVKAQGGDMPATAAPPGARLLPADDSDASGGANGDFECAGKKTCRQMVSCDEARFYLTRCGVKSLDGNRDGVPCNDLCR